MVETNYLRVQDESAIEPIGRACQTRILDPLHENLIRPANMLGSHPPLSISCHPHPKAYKDSKVCNVLMMREMDKRYSSGGMVVSALFPGCIAESPLFREKRGWFRAGFPVFQKFITRQLVSVEVRRKEVTQRAAVLKQVGSSVPS